MAKKLYLASPFFDATECYYYRLAIDALRSAGYDVFVPQEHAIEGGWEMPNEEWAKKVYGMDVCALHNCETVIVLNFGLYSDSGTAWEAGWALASGKRVIQVLCGGYNATYSLMMLSSADKVIEFHNLGNWEEKSAQVNLDEVIQK